jgi:hypothetical protein
VRRVRRAPHPRRPRGRRSWVVTRGGRLKETHLRKRLVVCVRMPIRPASCGHSLDGPKRNASRTAQARRPSSSVAAAVCEMSRSANSPTRTSEAATSPAFPT